MNRLIDNSGVFLMNKPYGWTSFDLVDKVRRLVKHYLQQKIKVGHTGTLDPLATGLMILCLGKETKNISLYTQYDKEYLATVNFSGTTASYDLEKPIEEHFTYNHVTKSRLLEVLQSFKGNIMQTPPEFSAKWVNGKRAYQLARKGAKAELKPVPVNIYELQLTDFSPPEFTIYVKCSKGTYIRALVRDIGKELTGGAYLSKLVRTAIGPFSLNSAISVEDFENMLKLAKFL